MKPQRPIGVLRLLEPLLGRGRRRRRGGPLVPMIWRRRLRRARPAPPQKAARSAPSTSAYIFNLTLVWPAGTAARAEPIRHFETRLREVFRAGRDAGGRETSRLVILVERLWLRFGKAGARVAALPSATSAPLPVLPANATPNGAGVSHGQSGRSALPAPAPTPRLWPRARMAQRRAALPPLAPAGAGEAASPGSVTVIVRAESGRADARVPRIHDLRRARVAAMRHGNEARTAMPPAGGSAGKEEAETVAMRAPAAMMWGAPAARAGSSESSASGRSVPSRPRTPLVWRKGEAGVESPTPGHPSVRRASGAELVWRRPPPDTARDEGGSSPGAAAAAAGRSDGYVRADRPGMPAAPPSAAAAPAAIQPAEMSRLVDEVVRRLDRIGRDERMRRGI